MGPTEPFHPAADHPFLPSIPQMLVQSRGGTPLPSPEVIKTLIPVQTPDWGASLVANPDPNFIVTWLGSV